MQLLYTFNIVPEQQGKNKYRNKGLKFDITVSVFSKKKKNQMFYLKEMCK